MIKKITNFLSLLKRVPSQDKNIATYEGEATVSYYRAQQPELQPAEQKIIELLAAELNTLAMLDIGVGAGRTSHFFAPRVKHYTGVDYSKRMISTCRELYPHFTFDVQDARNLSYPSATFDFVLFSFNGIDSISPADREQAIKEIHRVLKPSGYFAFSTHNINGLGHLFGFPLSINPKRWYKTIVLRNVNPGFREFFRKEFATILDGAHGYEITNHYTTPRHQVDQLAKAGLKTETLIDLKGRTCTPEEAATRKDLWLYYLCRKTG